MEAFSLALFARGQQLAAEKGLILVDTKYEFGKLGDQIYLIDEIHTPDSSRYFYAEDYLENFSKGLPPRQLSKEFVREWLMENGFSGQPGQKMPELTDEVIRDISNRYIELFEHLTGTALYRLPMTMHFMTTWKVHPQYVAVYGIPNYNNFPYPVCAITLGAQDQSYRHKVRWTNVVFHCPVQGGPKGYHANELRTGEISRGRS